MSFEPRCFESWFHSVVQNGFRPCEDGDLFGLESLTESRLQPLSQAGDLVGEQFLHWFLQEQREEVASMSTLLAIMERAGDHLLLVEDYLARQQVGDGGGDAGAPEAAGGSL